MLNGIGAHQPAFGAAVSNPFARALPQDFTNYLTGQIGQGVIPSLNDLLSNFNADPGTPEGQGQLTQASMLLAQHGPQGQERARQFSLLVNQINLTSTTGDLSAQSSGIEPDSPEALQLKARMDMIRKLSDQMGSQLTQSLAQDSSHGDAIQIQPGHGGNKPGGLFNQIGSMLESLVG